MIDAFSNLSLPEISTVARRTAVAALAVGVVALAGLALVGYVAAGLGVCVGLALAMVNFRLVARATVKASTRGREHNRRPLALNTLGRLGVVSVIALGLVFLDQPFGFGALVGLAAFQFVLLANVTVCMLRGASSAVTAGGERLDEDA